MEKEVKLGKREMIEVVWGRQREEMEETRRRPQDAEDTRRGAS